MSHSPPDLNVAFHELTAKYAVDVPASWSCSRAAQAPPNNGVALVPGWTVLDLDNAAADCVIPLQPWRVQRRFVELKRLLESHTVETPVMCRFSCQTTSTPMGLKAVLYREFDLLEWLTGTSIVAMHASIVGPRFANVLVRLANGIAASVEAGTTLPLSTQPAVIDRHEVIAQRGVASDRVVDTHFPQSSVYTLTPLGMESYTDTDAELFGLDQDDIDLVRAAYEAAARPTSVVTYRQQHQRLVNLVALAYESDRLRQRLTVEGGCSCSR